MTDRTDKSRGPRGNNARTGRAGRSRPATDKGRDGEGPRGKQEQRPPSTRRTADRTDGKPASKRAGRRPPRALRDRPGEEHAAGKGAPVQRGSGRPQRPGAAGKRTADGGPDRGPAVRGPAGRFRERPPKRGPAKERGTDGLVRLNRYLAQSGVCSRREADDLIKAGAVTVNGELVTELGTKVRPTDRVHYGGQLLSMEKKRYVLLNKPKGYITTTDDPQERRTVMALVERACPERLYPVGRLDRNTTGVLLLTNDGDLAKKLTHPSHGAEKIYHATVDKNVSKADLEQLVKGVPLDDGPAHAEEASYVQGATKREVGLKLRMGRNRVVRRMFEALGYDVVKLDRVVFAGLTKKDTPRGKWRHLSEKEVLFLSKRG